MINLIQKAFFFRLVFFLMAPSRRYSVLSMWYVSDSVGVLCIMYVCVSCTRPDLTLKAITSGQCRYGTGWHCIKSLMITIIQNSVWRFTQRSLQITITSSDRFFNIRNTSTPYRHTMVLKSVALSYPVRFAIVCVYSVVAMSSHAQTPVQLLCTIHLLS